MALPGVSVDRDFVLLRNDGSLVVFVQSDAFANGRSLGLGVPELCPSIRNKAADGCPTESR